MHFGASGAGLSARGALLLAGLCSFVVSSVGEF
jgi:hypothetical protein